MSSTVTVAKIGLAAATAALVPATVRLAQRARSTGVAGPWLSK